MYFKQLLIAFDQLLNTLASGYADETLSSRAYRMKLKGQPYWKWTANFIDAIFFDKEHCKNSYLSERNRTHLPPEFRD